MDIWRNDMETRFWEEKNIPWIICNVLYHMLQSQNIIPYSIYYVWITMMAFLDFTPSNIFIEVDKLRQSKFGSSSCFSYFLSDNFPSRTVKKKPQWQCSVLALKRVMSGLCLSSILFLCSEVSIFTFIQILKPIPLLGHLKQLNDSVVSWEPEGL